MTCEGWDWPDLVAEAQRRAALTGRRYRVHYDPPNHLWSLSETTAPTEETP
jgi:hypothetical protein